MLRKLFKCLVCDTEFLFCNVLIFLTSQGEPTCQKTITLEKASTLFNIAALYTQIGAKKDRTQLSELDGAVDCFLKAAGIIQHIIGKFFCAITNYHAISSRFKGWFRKKVVRSLCKRLVRVLAPYRHCQNFCLC